MRERPKRGGISTEAPSENNAVRRGGCRTKADLPAVRVVPRNGVLQCSKAGFAGAEGQEGMSQIPIAVGLGKRTGTNGQP
jgi:hypothetical protein